MHVSLVKTRAHGSFITTCKDQSQTPRGLRINVNTVHPIHIACLSAQPPRDSITIGVNEIKALKSKILELESFKEENFTLKRKIEELENSDADSKKVKLPGNLEEQKSFMESLQEIVGDSVSGHGAAREVLDLIHRKKRIGTSGYVKLYEKAYGTNHQYNCLCGKGPLGASGIYRHTQGKKSTEECHPVPMEYYRVLTKATSTGQSLD